MILRLTEPMIKFLNIKDKDIFLGLKHIGIIDQNDKYIDVWK